MHVSVSGLRAQKSTFFGPGPALDFSRNGLRKGATDRSGSGDVVVKWIRPKLTKEELNRRAAKATKLIEKIFVE